MCNHCSNDKGHDNDKHCDHYDGWVRVMVMVRVSDNDNAAYVDGSLVRTDKPEMAQNTKTSGDALMVLGGNPRGDFRCFSGEIAEVLVYNRALTSQEIKFLYSLKSQTTRNYRVALSLSSSPDLNPGLKHGLVVGCRSVVVMRIRAEVAIIHTLFYCGCDVFVFPTTHTYTRTHARTHARTLYPDALTASGAELSPGCYVKTPTNCPKQDFYAPDWVRDQKGEKNKNACLVTRKNDYNSWCEKSDITMKFVPAPATTTAAAGTTKVSAGYVLENAGRISHLTPPHPAPPHIKLTSLHLMSPYVTSTCPTPPEFVFGVALFNPTLQKATCTLVKID